MAEPQVTWDTSPQVQWDKPAPQVAVAPVRPEDTGYWDIFKRLVTSASGAIVGGAMDMATAPFRSPTKEEEQTLGPLANRANPYFAGSRTALAIGNQLKTAAQFYAGTSPDKTGAILENAAEGIGAGVGAVLGGKLIETGVKVAGATTGDPNLLYHKYLDPFAGAKTGDVVRSATIDSDLPPMSDQLRNSLTSQLGWKVGNNDLAMRVTNGQTTLGDLDSLRVISNKLGSPAFGEGYSSASETAGAYKQLSNQLRDKIYPQLEQAHGLKPGALTPIKMLQGAKIAVGNPIDNSKFNPYNPLEWGPATAEYAIKNTVVRGGVNVATRVLGYNMPEASALSPVQSVFGGNTAPPSPTVQQFPFVSPQLLPGAKSVLPPIAGDFPLPPSRAIPPQAAAGTPFPGYEPPQPQYSFGGPQATEGTPFRPGQTPMISPQEIEQMPPGPTKMPMGRGNVQSGKQAPIPGGMKPASYAYPEYQPGYEVVRRLLQQYGVNF